MAAIARDGLRLVRVKHGLAQVDKLCSKLVGENLQQSRHFVVDDVLAHASIDAVAPEWWRRDEKYIGPMHPWKPSDERTHGIDVRAALERILMRVVCAEH